MLLLILTAIAHLLLMLLVVLLDRSRSRSLTAGYLLFCAAIPVFGPICGLELIYAQTPDPELLRDLIHSQEEIHRSYTAPSLEAATTAPMEEAFLISEPAVRREMMMKLLYTDPGENLELLKLARFNDDPETAHYATATLTEYQRKLEMQLQQRQAILSKQPDNQEERLSYIALVRTYIDSGLLEGHLLLRQRTLLEQELTRLPEDRMDVEHGCVRAKNLLALGKVHEAIGAARDLMRRFPSAEEPWLELMRIYVECQDAHGLRGLKEEMQSANVMWSYQGLEKRDYFLKELS